MHSFIVLSNFRAKKINIPASDLLGQIHPFSIILLRYSYKISSSFQESCKWEGLGAICPLLNQLHNYTLSFTQGYKLIYLKIPFISPLSRAEFLIGQSYFYPLYHYQVGPRVPLKYLQAALYTIVVIYIWMLLYNKQFYIVTSRGQGTL